MYSFPEAEGPAAYPARHAMIDIRNSEKLIEIINSYLTDNIGIELKPERSGVAVVRSKRELIEKIDYAELEDGK